MTKVTSLRPSRVKFARLSRLPPSTSNAHRVELVFMGEACSDGFGEQRVARMLPDGTLMAFQGIGDQHGTPCPVGIADILDRENVRKEDFEFMLVATSFLVCSDFSGPVRLDGSGCVRLAGKGVTRRPSAEETLEGSWTGGAAAAARCRCIPTRPVSR